MRRDVRSSRPRLRKTRLPAVRLEAAEKARIGLFRAVRKIALRTLQEVFARMRPRGRLLLRLPSLIGGFFCSTATLSIVIVFAMKFFRQAVFSVSCAFAAVALPAGCSSAPAPTPDAPDGGDRSEYTYTLSQKKLLEIIAEQKVFFERVRTNSKMSRSDAVSLKNRLDSLWAEYFAEHPEDVDALLIHGKYLRAVGDDEAAYKEFSKADALNPNLPVVKQQLANYEAEHGLPKFAYANLSAAVALAPDVSVYRLQLADFILFYREELIVREKFTQQALDTVMMESYRRAARLEPENSALQWKYARAFYDAGKPDWNAALAQWNLVLSKFAPLNLDRQTALANKARVLIELRRDSQAREILETQIDLPALLADKHRLLEIINSK